MYEKKKDIMKESTPPLIFFEALNKLFWVDRDGVSIPQRPKQGTGFKNVY